MATFIRAGVTLAYDDIAPPGGSERTVVLAHGFASNRREGWKRTGWYDALFRRGLRCVALDLRGHGESEKLYDPAAYDREQMAADVLGLMDHLDLPQADLLGYSMGAHTALAAAQRAPGRLDHLLRGGVGGKMLEPADRDGTALAEAMLAEDPEAIADPMMRSFRHFADEQGEDRRALAACIAAPPRATPDPDALWSLQTPVLVVAGRRDTIAGDPEDLARCFPHGQAVSVPGCDHFSAIPHALVKAAVFDFLDGVLGEDDPFARRF